MARGNVVRSCQHIPPRRLRLAGSFAGRWLRENANITTFSLTNIIGCRKAKNSHEVIVPLDFGRPAVKIFLVRVVSILCGVFVFAATAASVQTNQR